MKENSQFPRLYRFGTFEVDVQSGELRKSGLKLKLSGQPFQVLAILLERPGVVVTREELQKRLWPDTFVDVDHNLNTAINKIREALGDSAENPRFVETLPRRGYRFVAPVEGAVGKEIPVELLSAAVPKHTPRRSRALPLTIIFVACVSMVGAGYFISKRRHVSGPPKERTLTRITFDAGLQLGVTWSPDGRYIAYSSDRGGKFDIWVQQLSGGDPVQITKGPDNNWEPDWSPDGKYIAYRSEEGEGGLYIVPALGGTGLERKITSFGYYPRWSPDSSRILLQTIGFGLSCQLYVVGLDGNPPRPVQEDLTNGVWTISAAWHPDGKRISIWVWDWEMRPSPIPQFWTASVDGGAATKTVIRPEILKSAETIAGSGISAWADSDFKFCWARSGTEIYFERTFRGARNIWRMRVDPQTLKALAIERLTTGTEIDSEFSVSPDGSRMAFTSESRRVQAWMFPFDAQRGRVTSSGSAVTSPGMEAWDTNISRDGRRLAFSAKRSGRWELWEKSLADGRETPIAADDSYVRAGPQWSPDGTRLAYFRMKVSSGGGQAVLWSKERGEVPITALSSFGPFVFDWSADGAWLLTSRAVAEGGQAEIWALPVAGNAVKGKERKLVACDAKTNLWQSRFSPDGRWVVFEAEAFQPAAHKSAIYVTPAVGGGLWTAVTEGTHWDDKPRWSPDGRIIYYLSERRGFFNVWGTRFDPVHGKTEGEPFQVTAFDNPRLMVAEVMPDAGLSLTQDKLIVTVSQVSGSIWVLDNVDR
ncbi:MAG TPA: winged helix-turn-helix domain-containing protein [Candidatus Solibacter sp.]|nr:winged helix-turn-helix domain-containing protein [Candidatus Solibacter sp.]